MNIPSSFDLKITRSKSTDVWYVFANETGISCTIYGYGYTWQTALDDVRCKLEDAFARGAITEAQSWFPGDEAAQ